MVQTADPSAAWSRSHSPSRVTMFRGDRAEVATNGFLIFVFVFSVMQPFIFNFGVIQMSPTRIFLLLAMAPAVFRVMTGQAGRIILPDVLMLMFGLWMIVCLSINQGFSTSLIYWLSQMVEVVAAYFAGRALVRSRGDYILLVKLMLGALLVLLPFNVFESVTGVAVLNDLYRKIPGIDVFGFVDYEFRLGLRRSQSVFAHPILNGVYGSTMLAFAWCALRAMEVKVTGRLFWSVLVVGSTFFALSSGPLVGLGFQMGLIGWVMVLSKFKYRWWLLLAGAVGAYVALFFVTDHGPIFTLANKASFNGATAWNRMMIWEFGTDEVMRHPIFGMGHFNDWIRHPWMPVSVDNHWLLNAMRYGLPGIAMLLGVYFGVLILLGRTKTPGDPGLTALRQGASFAFGGLFLTLCTVAAWHSVYSLLLFLLGASANLAFMPARALDPAEEEEELASRSLGRRRWGGKAAVRTKDRAAAVRAERLKRRRAARTDDADALSARPGTETAPNAGPDMSPDISPEASTRRPDRVRRYVRAPLSERSPRSHGRTPT